VILVSAGTFDPGQQPQLVGDQPRSPRTTRPRRPSLSHRINLGVVNLDLIEPQQRLQTLSTLPGPDEDDRGHQPTQSTDEEHQRPADHVFDHSDEAVGPRSKAIGDGSIHRDQAPDDHQDHVVEQAERVSDGDGPHRNRRPIRRLLIFANISNLSASSCCLVTLPPARAIP